MISREWPKDHWQRALTATRVRPGKFYATKHASIGVALTKGLNLKFIAEYCGTSVATIEQHYGRFLASRVDDPLALLAGDSPAAIELPREAKTANPGWRVAVLGRKTLME